MGGAGKGPLFPPHPFLRFFSMNLMSNVLLFLLELGKMMKMFTRFGKKQQPNHCLKTPKNSKNQKQRIIKITNQIFEWNFYLKTICVYTKRSSIDLNAQVHNIYHHRLCFIFYLSYDVPKTKVFMKTGKIRTETTTKKFHLIIEKSDSRPGYIPLPLLTPFEEGLVLLT